MTRAPLFAGIVLALASILTPSAEAADDGKSDIDAQLLSAMSFRSIGPASG